MDIERLKERKKELHLTNAEIAERSGVPLATVQKVMGGVTRNPRRETLVALAKVLDPPERVSYQEILRAREHHYTSRLSEEALQYGSRPEKKQGEYTVEDYMNWPEEQRIELIDGVIYDMAEPHVIHQVIAGDIHAQLLRCVTEHGAPWMPFLPVDVQLDKDIWTMVAPDVIMVKDFDLVQGRRIYGAPEFVVEVLSPSTRDRDLTLKLTKYKQAGCQELWIVDPQNMRVLVYCFMESVWPEVYTFRQSIPVHLSDGKCSISLAGSMARLEMIYGEDAKDLSYILSREYEEEAEAHAWDRKK